MLSSSSSKADHGPAVAQGDPDQPVSLVAVCAWCGSLLGKAVPTARKVVSHGMCRPCLEGLFAAQSRDLVAGR